MNVKLKARIMKKRRYIQQLLVEVKSVPCADCGKTYPPCVMDLDHRNPKTKKWPPNMLIYKTIKTFFIEVRKCDVICANCHRI